MKSHFTLGKTSLCLKSDFSYFHIFSKNDKKQKLSSLKEEALLVAHLNWTGQLMRTARRCGS